MLAGGIGLSELYGSTSYYIYTFHSQCCYRLISQLFSLLSYFADVLICSIEGLEVAEDTHRCAAVDASA